MYLSVIILNPPLLRQAPHRWIRPGAWLSHCGALLGSFLLIQSHWLQRSAVCNVSFMVRSRALWIPGSLSSLMVDVATKPLQPTSTGQTTALQPRCSQMPCLQPFPLIRSINSILPEVDQGIRSGLRVVVTICDGTVNRWPTSTNISRSLAFSIWPLLMDLNRGCFLTQQVYELGFLSRILYKSIQYIDVLSQIPMTSSRCCVSLISFYLASWVTSLRQSAALAHLHPESTHSHDLFTFLSHHTRITS